MPKSDCLVPSPHDISVTLLATTDVHGHLLAYDYYSDQQANQKPALSRLSSLIASERAANPNVILVDNGDFLQGTPLADLFTDLDLPNDLTHPVVAAMNYLNYDAAALGNHEFNTSLTQLNTVLRNAQFPLLCANLSPIGQRTDALKGLWQSQVILHKTFVDHSGKPQTVKIGLFGILPPQVLDWDHSRVSGQMSAQDSIAASRKAVSRLRANGADIVVGLAHTGLSTAPEHENMENAGFYIARIEGIDALVLGHSHLHFPGTEQPQHPDILEQSGTICGVPAVMPGSAAAYLGKIQLDLVKSGSSWKVRDHQSTLVPTIAADVTPEDPAFVSHLGPAHEWVLEKIRTPLGELSFPVHSYFALLPGCPTVRLVGHVQAKYLREKLTGTPLEGLPLLSAVAPQKCGGRSGRDHFTHIPKGAIALRNITNIQFFPNDVTAVKLKGVEIADWLEMSASIYNQVVPDRRDQPLRNEDFPPYNSDTIFGLTYEIDLTQPPRYGPDGALINRQSTRVRDILYKGAHLNPKQSFVLAVNNYRSGGGGGFPHVRPDRIVFESDTKIRDLLAKEVAQPPTLENLPSAPWRFSRISGASVIFDTGPGAKHFLDSAKTPSLEEVGTTSKGFLRMRLSLDV